MKPLLLNTFDQTGGAAKAAYRIFCGLQQLVTVKMLVRHKSSLDPNVIRAEPGWLGWGKGLLDILPLKAYPDRQSVPFTPGWVHDCLDRWIKHLSPDILHLHWLGDGFLRIETLHNLSIPVIWTMHDSWPFTGGCHLPGDCTSYRGKCGACPALGSQVQEDLSRRIWQRKQSSYRLDRMTFVAPSHWLADQARQSSLLDGADIEVIPNGVDTQFFSPGNRIEARQRLGLPAHRHLILFGARHALSDPNKGADLLWEVLKRIPEEQRRECSLVLIGEENCPENLPVDIELIDRGVIGKDSQMVDLYRAADLFLMTSRQENLPNMIAEAMSCGLPCIAFAIGGIPEQVSHHENGCLVKAYDVDAMSAEISFLLSAEGTRAIMGNRARETATANFSLHMVSQKYLSLYETAISSYRGD